MPASAGHAATLSYQYESSLNGDGDGESKPFGLDATLNTNEGNNNLDRAFEPGSREASQILEQHFEGSFSVEFTLTNPDWIGAVIAPGSSGSYSGELPSSMRILQGVDGHFDRELTGCIVNSATIETSTQDRVTVSLEGVYADEDPNPSGTQPSVTHRGLQFHNAQLQRDGQTLSLIQSVELSIENNMDLVWELGSRFAADYSPKQRTVTLDYGDIIHNSDNIDRFYGGGGSPSSTVTNEADATLEFESPDGNSISFSVTGMLPDTYSIDGVGDPEADLEGNLSEVPAGVSATSSGFGTTG